MSPRPGRVPVLKPLLVAVATALSSGCGSDATPGGPSPASGNAGAGACDVVSGQPALTTELVASGLDRPLDLQAASGDRARLFVVEQPGRIRVVRDGRLLETPFLDLTSRVSSGGERGLLGLAFHPRYAENRRFFVNYTDPAGDTHVAEFRGTSDPDRADPASERLLLAVEQPFSNHNGGQLRFGSDGRLYVGLGDGGSGGDPLGNAQNLGSLLGKILRLDVDAGSPYAVPADNPFVGRAGARGEIWAYGLRNPWRFAFDSATGDLLIGDVGQSAVEEIDLGLAARGGAENYGWNVTEGSRCFRPASGCDTHGITLPIVEYGHDQGCSVTGGVVYHGCRLPGWHGTYFYADFCSAFVRSFRVEGGRAVDGRDWTAALGRDIEAPSGFGVDADGEVYVLDLRGAVYRIVPAR